MPQVFRCLTVDPFSKRSPETRKLMFRQHQRDPEHAMFLCWRIRQRVNRLLWLTKTVFQCPTYKFPCIFTLRTCLCNLMPLSSSSLPISLSDCVQNWQSIVTLSPKCFMSHRITRDQAKERWNKEQGSLLLLKTILVSKSLLFLQDVWC